MMERRVSDTNKKEWKMEESPAMNMMVLHMSSSPECIGSKNCDYLRKLQHDLGVEIEVGEPKPYEGNATCLRST